MKKECGNCESYGNDYHGEKCCHHTANRAVVQDEAGNDEIVKTDFFGEWWCENFFPPNPTCKECRWYAYSNNGSNYCFQKTGGEPHLIFETRINRGCSRFQPNGKERK